MTQDNNFIRAAGQVTIDQEPFADVHSLRINQHGPQPSVHFSVERFDDMTWRFYRAHLGTDPTRTHSFRFASEGAHRLLLHAEHMTIVSLGVTLIDGQGEADRACMNFLGLCGSVEHMIFELGRMQ